MKDALGHGSDAKGAAHQSGVEQATRDKILAHFAKTGRAPNYPSVGGYDIAHPVMTAMTREGILKWVASETPSGRQSSVLRLASSPDRVIGRISRGRK